MAGLLQNAWLGWQAYKYYGKLAALLLAVLVFLCFTRKWRRQGALLLYTAVMTVCCILPVTAVLLMLYQTRFYDYEWIWSMVPLTAVTAYGISVFLTEYWTDLKGSQWRRGLPAAAFLLTAILLSGSLGRENGTAEKAERESSHAVLEQVLDICPGADICLWAPREIMEYARETDSRVRLPYGRNMWDISLNAYAYDIYDDSAVLLYQWMEQMQENGQTDEEKEELITLEDGVSNALNLGVNCILLPGNVEAEVVQRMEKALGTNARQVENYYLFLCQL